MELRYSIWDIVTELKKEVSEKTLHQWKKKYNWETKRVQFHQTSKSNEAEMLEISGKLQKVVHGLLDEAIADMNTEPKQRIDTHRLSAIARLITALMPSTRHDDEQKKRNRKSSGTLTKEQLSEIEQELFGM